MPFLHKSLCLEFPTLLSHSNLYLCAHTHVHAHTHIHAKSTWKILIHLLKTRTNIIIFLSSGPLQLLVKFTVLLLCFHSTVYFLFSFTNPIVHSTEFVLNGCSPCTYTATCASWGFGGNGLYLTHLSVPSTQHLVSAQQILHWTGAIQIVQMKHVTSFLTHVYF